MRPGSASTPAQSSQRANAGLPHRASPVFAAHRRGGAKFLSGANVCGRHADAAPCDGDRVNRLVLSGLALCLLGAGLAFWLSGTGPVAAANPFGTSGHFRMFAFANCGAPIMQQVQGACDPPPVSEKLPAAEQAQAHLTRHHAGCIGSDRAGLSGDQRRAAGRWPSCRFVDFSRASRAHIDAGRQRRARHERGFVGRSG